MGFYYVVKTILIVKRIRGLRGFEETGMKIAYTYFVDFQIGGTWESPGDGSLEGELRAYISR